MVNTLGVIGIIDKKINNSKVDPTDPLWVQTIKDHKEYLKSSSTVRNISKDYFRPYKYSLAKYLRSIGIPGYQEDVIRIVNDLPSDLDFKEARKIFIPSSTAIKSIKKLYLSSKGQS